MYNIGDGHDVIQDSPGNILEEDGDVLLFGAGILPDDVIVNHPADSLDDLVLTFSGYEGSVTLSGQIFYTTINYRPNEIEKRRVRRRNGVAAAGPHQPGAARHEHGR